MKAAVINSFGAPEVFEISDNHAKPVIKSNEILIKVQAGSVNPVDWKHRIGNHKYMLGSDFPLILGYDVAGIVEETGSDVKNIKVNDIVFGRLDRKYGGGLAEYAAGSENSCFTIDPDIPAHEAAAYPLAAITALQALRDKGCAAEGDKVLITGATGGVGHFAVQIAKNLGCNVTAVCGTGHEALLEKLKPHHIIRYSDSNFAVQLKQYDLIFDAAGKWSYLKASKYLLPGGNYVSILPRLKILAHKALAAFKSHKVKTLLMSPNSKDLQQIYRWIKEGTLFVHIDKTFTLENVAEAHRYSEKGHTEGKIAVTVS